MNNIQITLNLTRLIIGITILTYASYTDIKTRKASNQLWITMAITGAILITIQYLTTGINNPIYLIFIPLMIGFLYLLFQLRLLFGGADAKALMALTILTPLTPHIQQLPLYPSLMPFPWIILADSVIIFLIIPISLLILNTIKRNLKLPHMLLGYKMITKKAKTKHVWPLETLKNGKRKFLYMPKEYDTTPLLNEFEQNNIKNIWVTPKIPFMIPLLIGFILSFTIGDIMTKIIDILTTML